MYPISDFAAIQITKARHKELMDAAEKERLSIRTMENNRQNRRQNKVRNRAIR